MIKLDGTNYNVDIMMRCVSFAMAHLLFHLHMFLTMALQNTNSLGLFKPEYKLDGTIQCGDTR